MLDSSVVIAAERNGLSTAELISIVVRTTNDSPIGISAVALTELVHGVHRAHTPERRQLRENFLAGLLSGVPVFPYDKEVAFIAGRISGEQQVRGITVPYADLLIGATALASGFGVLTLNVHDFQLIPGLEVIQFA